MLTTHRTAEPSSSISRAVSCSCYDAAALLARNRQAQQRVREAICVKECILREVIDLLQAVRSNLVPQSAPETLPDWASPKQRYQYHRRDGSVHHDPFRCRQSGMTPIHPEGKAWEEMFSVFPRPFGNSFEITWTSDLDDLLQCTVSSLGLDHEAHATKKEPKCEFEPTSSSRWYFGSDFSQWQLVAEVFNSAVATDSNFKGSCSRVVSAMDCVLRYGNVLLCRQCAFTCEEDAVIVEYAGGCSGPTHSRAQIDAASSRGPFVWTTIASEIATRFGFRRSAFQCASRFQRVLNQQFLLSSEIRVVDVVGRSNARSVVVKHGAHSTGQLCLAINNNFETPHTCGRWIPWQRMASHASRVVESMVQRPCNEKQCKSSLFSMVHALMIAQFALLCRPRLNVSLTALLHVLRMGMRNRQKGCVSATDSDSAAVDVDYEDMIFADRVCRERYGVSIDLSDCARLLSCSPEDVQTIVVNEWMRARCSMNYARISERVFGRPELAAVVRTLLLGHFLDNRLDSGPHWYPCDAVLHAAAAGQIEYAQQSND